MNSNIKKVAITAAGVVVAGILLAGIGFILGGNKPIFIGPDGFQVGSNRSGDMESFKTDLEQFQSIDADLSFYDVDLIPSDKYAIEGTYNKDAGKPRVKVENGKLTVADNNDISFNLNIMGFHWNDKDLARIKIYYPKDAEFKNIKITCNASDLVYENLKADAISLNLDLGKLEAKNITANQLEVDLDSGDCILEKITADNLKATNDLGKISLSDSVLKTINMEADSGDIDISSTKAEQSILKLDLGSLTVDGVDSKGMDVTSSSGDVKIKGKIQGLTKVRCDLGSVTVTTDLPKEQYNYELQVDLGQVYLGNDKVSSISSQNGANLSNTMDIQADTGDIRVNFN